MVVCVLAVLLSVFMKQRGDALVDPPMKIDRVRLDGDSGRLFCQCVDEHGPQIFIYPIKSLPACAVRSAKLDARGFEFDRRFMLYSPAEGDLKEKNHCVSNSPFVRPCLQVGRSEAGGERAHADRAYLAPIPALSPRLAPPAEHADPDRPGPCARMRDAHLPHRLDAPPAPLPAD